MTNLKEQYLKAYQEQHALSKQSHLIEFFHKNDLVQIFIPKQDIPWVTKENAKRVEKILQKLTSGMIDSNKKKGLFTVTISGKKRDIIIELILFNGLSLSDFHFKITIQNK